MENIFQKNGVTTTLGGTSPTLVIPKINLSRYSDEFWLDVNHRESVAIARDDFVSSRPDQYEIVCGDIKHVFYQTNDGLEYEIWFQTPPKPEILLDLTVAGGLTFVKQPALSEEEIHQGCVRPDEIVDSYAVFCGKQNGPYETGKVFHIKRPFLMDSKGKKIWCDQTIADKVWRIRLPEAELANLAYPICLGPEIGYSTQGASTQAKSADMFYFAGGQNSGYGGTVNFLKAYVSSAGIYGRAGVYSGSVSPSAKSFGPGEELLIELTSPYSFPIGDWTLAPSTNYWITLELNGFSDTFELSYDTAEGSLDFSGGIGYYPFAWPNPVTNLMADPSKKYSIWLDYTETIPEAAEIPRLGSRYEGAYRGRYAGE